MNNRKKEKLIALLFVCLFVTLVVLLLQRSGVTIRGDDFTSNGIKRVYARAALEREARGNAEAGNLDRAIQLYGEAIAPVNINQEHEKSTSVGALTDIYIWRCEYEKALQIQSWFLRHDKPAESALEQKREIEALLVYRDTGDRTLLAEHINKLKKSYAEWLPPIANNTYTPILISDFIRLYNTMGEHDAGIRMIDEILNWAFSRPDSELKNIKRPATAAEALEFGRWTGGFNRPRDSEWRAYKYVWQYLTIREAFEQDKKDGFKGCAHSPPGQVCMGKATKALIQSDYFPW